MRTTCVVHAMHWALLSSQTIEIECVLVDVVFAHAPGSELIVYPLLKPGMMNISCPHATKCYVCLVMLTWSTCGVTTTSLRSSVIVYAKPSLEATMFTSVLFR